MVYNIPGRTYPKSVQILSKELKMSKKTVVGILEVILWLTLPSFLSAQAPEPTKPTSATAGETQPCWEKEIEKEVSAENKNCYAQFLQEVDQQIKAEVDQQVLESLELAGVRFVKAMGISEKSAAEIVAKHFTELELRNVLKVPNQNQETTRPAEVKPAPAVLEVTPKRVELVKRTDSPTQNKRLRDERREGWKAGLPEPEKKTGYCWEESRPEDLDGCVVQLKQYINQIREDKSLHSEDRDLAVKNFRFNLEKLKKLQKLVEKGLKARRTEETSRANAMLRGCGDKTQVHEDFAGPGARYLESVTVNIFNNTGGEIREIKFGDRGIVVQNLCAGGSLTLHRHLEGQPQGINSNLIAKAVVFEGGVQKSYVWEIPVSLYRGSINQAPITWTLTKENRRTW